jgi:repressor LexA
VNVVRKPLTNRQENIFKFICEQIQKIGYPPTVREIGAAFGISEKGAHDHLNAIEKKNYIRRMPGKPRAIEIIDFLSKKTSQPITEVPIVGRVAAGKPLLASQNIEGTLPLPNEMANGDRCFALRVRGSSMIDAGIFEGDFVVVRSQEYADAGDIVVALLDDEATVKRFFVEGDKIRLQPENATLSPIVVDNAQILGKVIGLFRQM